MYSVFLKRTFLVSLEVALVSWIRDTCLCIPLFLCRHIPVLSTCNETESLALNLTRWLLFVFFLILPPSVTTSAACEKLERDRNELQVTYEGFLQKLNEQHHNDLAELEERLKQFYTAECEKLQSICIEEAEKYKAQLQEQVCGVWSRNILQQLFSATNEPSRNLDLLIYLFIYFGY